ncbi:DUF4239 domain-containing protein [Mycolicibacterium sp. S2-37]|uniref:bestrophin-like domain n=1 Tax=Mycolicibacterium sp. S2-37 TaxID=2810297 RepID=UPI001A942AC5|nr:DUF4239 domain-containing protein [Mycolicibacterium sp. S2-37]MBO0675880.1 DUF4239 domain-containing protein [Mycolicibacterium sp. S2-37]
MSRWLVSGIPSWVLLVGLVVIVAGGGVLVQTYVRRRFTALTGDEHKDVTKFTYSFIGFIYAFFIGFVVSSMWGAINSADTDARSEGATAVQMATAAEFFTPADTERIRSALRAYESAAIAEWSETTRTPAADAALRDLYSAYAQVQATTDTQKTLLSSSWSSLEQISQARTERILTSREDTGPPWPIWVVILLTSAMVLGTAIVYGVEKASLHYPMVIIVGVIVATNLFLVLELSHPYVGVVAIPPDRLQEVLSVLPQ